MQTMWSTHTCGRTCKQNCTKRRRLNWFQQQFTLS